MADEDNTSDTSIHEFDDQLNVSLLPETDSSNSQRQSKFHCLKLNRKAAIFVVVAGSLLLLVVLLAAFLRPSSAAAKEEKKDQVYQSLRLPRHLSPIEYLVYLHPNLTTFKYSGKVEVLLYCNEAANNITLHVGKEINYNTVRVAYIPDLNDTEGKQPLQVKKISRLAGEMIWIALDSELQSGKYYSLIMEFDSELSKGLSGFYLSKYTSPSGQTRYLATTQFEPTDARNAFPCFDEPNMKAKFSIVIKREKRHVALSNMPLERTEGCNDTTKSCTDHFKQSVKMSTYLVAFVVCDFKNIKNQTKNGVQVRVWAPPEQIELGRFALDVGVKVLEYYEETFKIAYPLPKQDLIAIPDFAAGAMENWGLITYRLTSLLYDKNKSSDSNKERVAVVVAHELAHQWFGNLVTMEWWNDLWLNEGFASFMENVGVDHIYPEWKMMDQALLFNNQGAMAEDQLTNSHPIMAEVKDPAQINSLFDSISYDKGSAIIRMLEDVLGREVFFQGLQRYLKKYSFSNAETNDLWECLTNEAKKRKGGLDVTEMMTTWTNQMGFPVITVKRDVNSPQMVHVEQQRFLIHPLKDASAKDTFSWVVPLTYVTKESDERKITFMKKKTEQVHLPSGTKASSWIKMNAGQTGFYRVNYENENWKKLVHQLNASHQTLSAADRAGLLDDALNLARSGMLADEVALNLTTYLKKEREYVPWMSALDNMAYFATQFTTYDSLNGSTDYYSTYKKYILYLLYDVADELGWVEKSDDPLLKRYLRASVLDVVASYEDALPKKKTPRHTAKALDLFKEWLFKGKPIAPNLRSTVYSIGIKDANDSTWMEVFKRFQSEAVPSEKRKLMYALTNSRNKGILTRLLGFSLDETKIRSQDSVAVIDSIARNPEGRLIAWKFVQDNYDKLFNRYGKGSFDFSRLIKSNTAHFNTEEMKTQVSQFFAKVDQGSGERAVRQSLESIDTNIKWINNSGIIVYTWLKHFLDNKKS
ncbi:endoplasmic reticulum aminopeptidase 1-like [Oculina patagonica]